MDAMYNIHYLISFGFNIEKDRENKDIYYKDREKLISFGFN